MRSAVLSDLAMGCVGAALGLLASWCFAIALIAAVALTGRGQPRRPCVSQHVETATQLVAIGKALVPQPRQEWVCDRWAP